ncbi:histidinol-phosphate transaminase [Microbacterium sp. zg.Y1090]|uniref:histidinol-phosphate transaminase n=1 Tax=Microbacterium wangruii TaxID=3049073 RepID=UPI00214CF2D8|nr:MULTISPECIES: histidinol-phosphate transaminase [unclassified Microbacterium]MCR2817412.1 histidinol-phosphate transaminase [Microbacterium sp. zg.Y1090]WIM29102.1 histidinol-phosphate transaminase [Microbacterium sp. zg-Y1090]
MSGALRMRKGLDDVPAYKQGRPASVLEGEESFKISSNENPYPPLPAVVDAVAATLTGMNRYPEFAATALTARVAARFDVAPENIVFGAGSVEVVSQLIRATSAPGNEVVFAWRSFEAYPMLVRTAGAVPVEVPLNADHGHDLDAMLTAVTERTSLIMVCNPNNPTGTTVGAEELTAFLDAVPAHVTVLLDEAYVHFNRRPDTAVGIAAFRAHPNVVVAHTFSKAYGLAGMRVGYAIAPALLVAAMRKMAIPFGVTTPAQIAALASLEAEDELQVRVDALIGERERIVAALSAQGWQLPETETNFLWFPLGDDTTAALEVFEAHGLSVRGFAGEGLRATIAETQANNRLLDTAAELVSRGLTGGCTVAAAS